jgi:hypothetical protein
LCEKRGEKRDTLKRTWIKTVLEGILRVEQGAEEGDGFRAKRENFLSLTHSTHGSLENS